jgi:hypothetical protein
MRPIYNDKLSKLIGIPFKIGHESFEFCDCVGISWLYHFTIHGKDYPHRDGKPFFMRDKRKDVLRILTVLRTWAHQVGLNELKEGDLVILRSGYDVGCLGVVTEEQKLLFMDKYVGSMLGKISAMRHIFLKGFRPNET